MKAKHAILKKMFELDRLIIFNLNRQANDKKRTAYEANLRSYMDYAVEHYASGHYAACITDMMDAHTLLGKIKLD